MNPRDVEAQLRELGTDWPKGNSLLEGVLTQIETTSMHSDQLSSRQGWFTMKYSLAALFACAFVGVCFALQNGQGNVAFGEIAASQILEMAERQETIRQVVTWTDSSGEKKSATVWYARGLGFASFAPEKSIVDNGKYHWEHLKGSKVATRESSEGTDKILAEMMYFSGFIPSEGCQRQKSGDIYEEGESLKCYELLQASSGIPEKLSQLFVYVDHLNLARKIRVRTKHLGKWKTSLEKNMSYGVGIPKSIFEPKFGDHIEIVDREEQLSAIADLSSAIYLEEKPGLLFAVHRACNVEGGGVAMLVSARTPLLKGVEASVSVPKPNRRASDWLSKLFNSAPQFHETFRIKLADAEHKNVYAQWYLITPRNGYNWDVDKKGKLKMRTQISWDSGISPWDFYVDVEGKSPPISIEDVARAVYQDQSSIDSISNLSLLMGVEEKGGQLMEIVEKTNSTTESQYVNAVKNRIRVWRERTDAKLREQLNAQAHFGTVSIVVPALNVRNNKFVNDEYVEMVFKRRPSLVSINVSNTAITDKSLTNLQALSDLAYLDLSGCLVSDASLMLIKSKDSLRELDVRKTRVSHRGIIALKLAQPKLNVRSDFD